MVSLDEEKTCSVWKAKVIADTGDHYLKPNAPNGLTQGGGLLHAKPTRSKLTIRGVAN